MNQKKYTMFMRMHPLVNFMYFLVMMLFVMFYVHPVLLGIAGIVCFAYLCYLGGNKQFRTMLTLIPFIMLLSLINPLFNRNGDTVLCYVFHRPITLEASLYGLVAALMIYDMILLFRVFHIIMSSDKIICLFSKMLPIGTLLFTMTLRFVPMYKAQLAKMRLAQKGIQHDVTQGTRIQKIRNGVELISGLITWALENGLESADSMKGRGYGLSGRTSYANMKFTKLDWNVFALEVVLALGLLYGSFHHVFQISYYPVLTWRRGGMLEIVCYSLYGLFALIPLIIDYKEEMTWHFLRQKI
ncbi:MAG TPA: cobalt transporter [Lachnospiraceae bacterium]|nr:cobalt transporter [Lachnospiraceae bacterium]